MFLEVIITVGILDHGNMFKLLRDQELFYTVTGDFGILHWSFQMLAPLLSMLDCQFLTVPFSEMKLENELPQAL